METQNTFNGQRDGEHARLSSAGAQVWLSDGRTLRLNRADEYEASRIARAEPSAAFQAAIQAELFRIAVTLEDAVQESVSHCPAGADGLRAAHRPITQYICAARQIEQNARLEIHARNAGSRHHKLDS